MPRIRFQASPHALLLASLALAIAAEPAMAQPTLRSTFPGRRIGGGTRGDCTGRLLAHLVPPSSVFAPGASRTLGLLEGPAAEPTPLQLQFRPLSRANGSVEPSSRGAAISRDLPPARAGVTLFTLAVPPDTTMWASSYRCGSEAESTSDPLAFVVSATPPALSLLVKDVTPADRALQDALASLRKACGGTIALQEVSRAFGLEIPSDPRWPQALPVRCF